MNRLLLALVISITATACASSNKPDAPGGACASAAKVACITNQETGSCSCTSDCEACEKTSGATCSTDEKAIAACCQSVASTGQLDRETLSRLFPKEPSEKDEASSSQD